MAGLAALRRPAVLILAVALVASRVAYAAFPVVFVVALAVGRGYGTAAVLQGLMTFTLLVSAPYRARILDRFGRHRALVPQSAGYLLCLVAVAFLAPMRSVPVAAVGVLVVVCALLSPPLNAAIRASWRHAAADADELKALHTMDSLLEEAGFFLGPVVGSLVMLGVGPRQSLPVMALLSCFGFLLVLGIPAARRLVLRPLVATPPKEPAEAAAPAPTGPRARLTRVAHTVLGPIARTDLREVVTPLVVMGFSFGLLAISIPAVTEASGSIASAGFVTAAISAGGVIGGLVYGALRLRNSLWQRQALLSFGFGVPIMLVALIHSPIPLAAILLVAGLSVTPLYINSYLLIDDGIPVQVKHEANAWVAAGNDVGYVLGITLGGILLPSRGLTTTLWVAGAAGLVLIAVAVRGAIRAPRQTAAAAAEEAAV